MKIADIIGKDSIEIGLEIDNKNNLIDKMLELAAKSGKVTNPEKAKNEIFIREKIMSTGVGDGIALPHAKTNAVEASVGSFALLKNPVDFDSLDNEPVNIVFLLLGREDNVGNHLRVLSKISRFLNNDSFRQDLIESKSSEDIINLFDRVEQ